jgi:hypothetical protein
MGSSEATRRRSVRSTWTAVAAAEVLVATGVVLVFIAIAASLQFCTGSLGCDEESSNRGGGLLLLLPGVVAILAAPAAVSYLSGRPSPGRATVRSVLALLGTFGLAAGVLGDALAGLAVALGLGGSLALPPPSSDAMRTRIVTVLILVVLSATIARPSATTAFVVALLALPALNVDAIARPRAANGERRHRDHTTQP